jgi:hypothetical protein
MYTIRCARCNKRIFKYQKVGKGRLWHCWLSRIVDDNAVYEGNSVKCSCGNLVGMKKGKYIKLKQHAFTCSGSTTKG